ncbi:MAG: acyl carrier protein [Roseovarius sp.]|jgi:acyl carrier protein|nr:acyl carrier protein [Roseovarius sp.]
MTDMTIETALSEELHRIAPDIGLEDIDRTQDLREEFDIDSMDFLTLVTALGKRFDLDMPEADYPKMQSFEALLDYLRARTEN